MAVPNTSSLADVYSRSSVETQSKRWNSMLQTFRDRYGCSPDFIARSPGRVNIIGEHIDYSLYEVLPMAVEADVLVAVKVQAREGDEGPRVRLGNVNGEKFKPVEFEVGADGKVEIDNSKLEWSNYFKAGFRGAAELLGKKRSGGVSVESVDVLVDGTVPSGGGLSSSAAFVCASALATLVANGEKNVDQKELVELAIVSERAVGVHSGGMDQSASVFPQKDKAVYVSFKPSLSVRHVTFPDTTPEFTFVVAQSFVAADKHTSAAECYNLRVAEVSMAATLLARIFRLGGGAVPEDESPLGISLRGFHDAYFGRRNGGTDNTKVSAEEFGEQLKELRTLVEDYMIQEEGYTREEIAGLLGISIDELKQRFESKFEVRAERFMLRQRALHVFGEAARVLKFMALLDTPVQQADGATEGKTDKDEELLKSLGELMHETQTSCRDVYECSCAELDELCTLAREAGAYGSRLTGAGWGGCSVHLVAKRDVEKVKEAWREKYYAKRFPDLDAAKMEQAVVVSTPGSGSCLFKIEGERVT